MGIDEIKRIRSWEKIVETLKSGPDFGIHGTSHEKLEKILRGEDLFGIKPRSELVMAHYFAVGGNVKSFPNEEFYEGLWASIDTAIGFSVRYSFSREGVDFTKLPCLLLGIPKPQFRNLGLIEDRDTFRMGSSYHNKDQKNLTAFPVAHDFNRELHNLYGLVISDVELAKINAGLTKFCKGGIFDDLAKTYFVQSRLIIGMIRKIYRKISQTK